MGFYTPSSYQEGNPEVRGADKLLYPFGTFEIVVCVADTKLFKTYE